MKASKLVGGIKISLKKYNPTKILIDSNNFETFSNENKLPTNSISQLMLLKLVFLSIKTTISNVNSILQPKKNNNNGIAKLCTLCIDSKFNQLVR